MDAVTGGGLAALKGTYYGMRIWRMASKSMAAQRLKNKMSHAKADHNLKKGFKEVDNKMKAEKATQNIKKQNEAMRDALKKDLKKTRQQNTQAMKSPQRR